MQKTFKHRFLQRITAFVMAMVSVIGYIPSAAFADTEPLSDTPWNLEENVPKPAPSTTPPPESIIMSGYKSLGSRFYAAPMGCNVSRYNAFFNVDGKEDIPGFCADHGEYLGSELVGKQWINPKKIGEDSDIVLSDEARRLLDYYYYQVALHEYIHSVLPERPCSTENDQAIYDGLPEGEDGGKYEGSWMKQGIEANEYPFQTLVWLAIKYGNDFKPISDTTYRNMLIDIRVTESGASRESVEKWWNDMCSFAKADLPEYTYYSYECAVPKPGTATYGSRVQRIIVPRFQTEKEELTEVYIKIKKTDKDGNPLSGAKFKVYYDSTCKLEVDGGEFTSSGEEWSISGKLQVNEERTGPYALLWVKEIEAPPGYEPSPTAVSIAVSLKDNTTPEKAAYNESATIINYVKPDKPGPDPEVPPDTPTPMIFKVDANTNQPVGPATFHIEGNGTGVDPNKGINIGEKVKAKPQAEPAKATYKAADPSVTYLAGSDDTFTDQGATFQRIKIPDSVMTNYGSDTSGDAVGASSDNVKKVKEQLSKMTPNEFVSRTQMYGSNAKLFDAHLETFLKVLYKFCGLDGRTPKLNKLTCYIINQIPAMDQNMKDDIERLYKYTLIKEGKQGTISTSTSGGGKAGAVDGVYNYAQTAPMHGATPLPMKGNADTIQSHGCGVCCTAMVLSTYYNREILPEDLAKYVTDNGWRDGTGLANDKIGKIRNAYTADHPETLFGNSVPSVQIYNKADFSQEQLIQALQAGKMIVMRQGNPSGDGGTFTSREHFIQVYGYENGKFLICDPYERPGGHYPPLGSQVIHDSNNISKVSTNGAVLYDKLEQIIVFDGDKRAITLSSKATVPFTLQEDGLPENPVYGLEPLTSEPGGSSGPDHGTVTTNPNEGEVTGYISMDIATDENGRIELQWWNPDGENYISPGEYTVTEKVAPPGFELSTEARHLSLHFDKTNGLITTSGPLVFKDYKKKKILIKKIDQDGNPLPGAIFGIYKDGELLAQTTTNPGGELEFYGPEYRGLESGHYVIEELVPPDGYLMPAIHSAHVQVDAEDRSVNEYVVTMKNYIYPEIIIKKLDAGTLAHLKGAIFKVTIDGRSFQTAATSENGTLIIKYETYGEFLDRNRDTHSVMVEEIVAPDGYTIDKPNMQQQEIVKGQKLQQFIFTDTGYPRIIISKVKRGTLDDLKGAVFQIDFDGTQFGTITTDRSGRIVIDYDTYRRFLNDANETHSVKVTELKAPDGYLVDEPNWQELLIRRGQKEVNFTFSDTMYPSIIIIKRDRETQALLPNTEFTVAIDGVQIGNYKTDENGQIKIDYETYKHYLNEENHGNWVVSVTETKVPDKYNLDNQPESVGGSGTTVTQTLRYGQSLLPFEFEDTHFRDLRVRKVDAQTNYPLEGATFTLHCVEAANQKSGSVADRVGTTDGDGYFTFKDLPNGTYELYESSAPMGYSEDGVWADDGKTGKKTVVITSDSDRTLEFEYKNEPQTGFLIRKIDSVTKQPIPNVRFKITPLEPLTSPSWEAVTDDNGVIVRESLPEGSYRIEEISTVQGYVLNMEPQILQVKNQHDAYTVTFENNQTNMLNILKLDSETGQPLPGAQFSIDLANGSHVAAVTTGIYGYANLADLKPGNYIVKEIKAPDGHLIDPNPQTFEVPADSSGRTYTLTFYNTPRSNLFLRKYDAITNIGLAGARFKIWKGSGEVVTEDAYTDEQGFIQINDLAEGTYFIQETQAPSGYILNTEVYSIHLENRQTKTVEIPNTKRGGVSVRKIDANTKQPLRGAEFQLAAFDGTVIGTAVSGADGYARWPNVEPGRYVLTETAAPEGYQISQKPMNIKVEEFASAEIEWPNNQKSSLTIIKRDAETNELLAGATFEIRSMSGKIIGTVITDSTGTAVSGLLEAGLYKVVETKAPDGHLLNEEEFTVEIKENEQNEIEIRDVRERNLVILKIDANTKKPLPGAVIEIKTVDNKLIGSFETDQSGTITTPTLKPGHYKATEIKAPDGYILDSTPHPFEVKAGQENRLTIENTPETVIQIQKTDAITGDPLQDVEFEIQDSNGKTVEFVTTDKTGWAHSSSLPYGRYQVRETKAPAGYTLSQQVYPVDLEKGKNAVLNIENAPDTTLIITKVDIETRKGLAGAEFELKYDKGNGDCTYIGTYTTDEQGMIHTDPLQPGFYIIKETRAPQGYVLTSEEIRYCVKSSELNQVVIENTPEATLVVRKIDSKSNKPLAGAEFKVQAPDGSLIGTKKTDANGEAAWTGLKAGTYTVTEVSAPSGYSKTRYPKTIHVEYGKTSHLEFKDDENGSLKIVLQDKNTGAYLAEGHFIVTRESDQIVVFDSKTDVTGTLLVGELLPGWYTVEQAFAPKDYSLIEPEQKIQIQIGEQAAVYFKNETAGLVVEKIDRQNPTVLLEGARFQVKSNEGEVIGEYVTGKDGLMSVGGLSDGLYTITELAPPIGYSVKTEPQLVHVRGGSVAHVTFMDTQISSITINMYDKTNEKPLAGVTAEVWSQNGSMVNTYTSDTTGLIQTDKLPSGFYVLKVTEIPEGCTIVGEPEVTVELRDGVECTYKFEFSNTASLKFLSVDANDVSLEGMRFSVKTLSGATIGDYKTGTDGSAMVSLKPGTYIVTETVAPIGYSVQPEQQVEVTKTELTQIVFKHTQLFGLKITSKCFETGELVPDVVYNVESADGTPFGTVKGDVFKALEPGWYVVTPKATPNGFRFASTDPVNIEIKEGQLATLNFSLNQMSTLKIKVIDGDTNKSIPNVKLLLKDRNKLIKEYYTDGNGNVRLDFEILQDYYSLTMIDCPKGYILDNIPQTIETLAAETTNVTWKLYKKGGQIQVKVTSADQNFVLDKSADTPLEGAVFEITNADTYQVVGKMISDKSGFAASSPVPIGRYMVRMISAPAYYAINADWEEEIRIKINNDVVATEMKVNSVNLGSDIALKSNTTVKAGMTMRVDVVTAANTSDVRLDHFYLHIKVPTDAVRAATINTGKWSHAVFYTLSYKTNMNDYRPIATTLQSKANYQYSLSTQSLDLQSGEYVTDVRMEFNTVPKGFKMVEKACFTQYVLSTVSDNYKIVSRAEIGGQFNTVQLSTTQIDNKASYSPSGASVVNGEVVGGTGTAAIASNSGQWTKNTATWSTTVRSDAPKTLPTTGY